MTNSTVATITSTQLEEMTFNVITCEIEESNADSDSWEEPSTTDRDGNIIYETKYNFSRQVWGAATLRSETDPSITVVINWQADSFANMYVDQFDFNIAINESMSHPITIEGAAIIDNDGSEVNVDFELREKFKGGEWESHVSHLLPTAETEELTEDADMTTDSDLEVIEISRDNAPDLKFTGVEIASASSKDPYNNNNGRWTVLKLFRTKGGKFIAQSIGRTQWQGEKDRYAAEVCENHAEVIAFFGHGRLAKDIYAEANIADIQNVD